MGSLNRFLGKPKEIEIKGNKIMINPIKVKDMVDFSENPTPEKSMELAKRMIKLSVPDTTDEELDEMPLEVFTQLIEEINKFNGFTDERLTRLNKNTGNK